MDDNVLIIGAGPAGLAAASILSEKGKKVTVLEATDAVGGMARSIKIWDRIVDIGPHRFFSSDPRINGFWLDALGSDFTMVTRKTRILYGSKFFDYPLSPINALVNLGFAPSISAIASYIRARIYPPRDTSNFESWVVSRFGRKLFDIFFKSYTEKLWGIPCDKLDADFAMQRIKQFSLFEAIKSAFRINRRSKHRTLVDEFAYPTNGAGHVYENLKSKILENNSFIHFDSIVTGLLYFPGNDFDGNKGFWKVNTRNGNSYSADHVISTMPLTQLVKLLDPPAHVKASADTLRFRNTILVYLLIDKENLFSDQWLYVNSKDMMTGRITNFNNWNETIRAGRKDTILSFEYWSFNSETIWKMTEVELVAAAKSDLVKAGIADADRVLDSRVIRVPNCYPVYDTGYQAEVLALSQFVDSFPKLYAIGRYGSFKYNNQDHSLLMGLLAADNILLGTKHDLWSINSDTEYQEGSRITSTGLVIDE